MSGPLFASLEDRYRLPSGILDSVWNAESSRGKNMISPAGALGHFQFMPATAKEQGVTDPNDLNNSAAGAARYLRTLIDQTGDVPAALAAYNWGIGNVQRKGLERAPAETRNYIEKVTSGMAQQNDPWAALGQQFGTQQPVTPTQQDPWAMIGQQFTLRAPDQPLSGANVYNRLERSGVPAGTGQYSSEIPAPELVPALPVEQQQSAPPPQAQDGQPPERGLIGNLARQLGLTARYGLEGVGQAAQLVTEPLRTMVVNPLARMVGAPEADATGQVMTSLADGLGLPAPESAQERIVGDASRLVAGAGGGLGAARGIAQLPGMVGQVGGLLGMAPASQAASAAGAGAVGGLARENGGGDLAQAGAGLLGGVAGGLGAGLLNGAGRVGVRAANAIVPRDIEVRFTQVLADAGVDRSTLPKSAERTLRAELETALRTGRELRPDAVRRLADFRTVGATPTRGMITQDPVQITREQNLAKIAANSNDNQLAALPRMQNENNATLIRNLNDAGAAGALDAYATGASVIGSIDRSLSAQQGNINALYSTARDSAGRSFPLDGRSFADRAMTALDDQLLGGALPADVRNRLNDISAGRVPFTVDYAEQLKTAMGKLQRNSSDGQARMALGVVRGALEDTPVLGLGEQTAARGARAVNPGNLPAIPGSAGASVGEDAVAAFNQARAANRQMMGRVEANPAVKAIYDGDARPDDFVQKYIVGTGASVKNVRDLRSQIAQDPQAIEAVRGSMVDWLKQKALGGASDETGKFSQSAYNKALGSIGTRKLESFFSPEEVASLRALGRVSSYMQAQPVGSAVNNSNSGALLAGRGYDLIKNVARYVPLGEAAILNPLRNIDVTLSQRRALNVGPGLLSTAARPAIPAGAQYLLPGAAMGGLLAAPTPGADRRKDNQ